VVDPHVSQQSFGLSPHVTKIQSVDFDDCLLPSADIDAALASQRDEGERVTRSNPSSSISATIWLVPGANSDPNCVVGDCLSPSADMDAALASRWNEGGRVSCRSWPSSFFSAVIWLVTKASRDPNCGLLPSNDIDAALASR